MAEQDGQTEEEREENAAKTKKQDRKTAVIFLAVFVFLLIAATVLLGMNLSNMRDWEQNGEKVIATVTGIRTDHYIQQGTHSKRNRYYRVFTYAYNGNTYEGQDGEGWKAYKEGQLGTQIEIYVDPQNPAQSKSVSSVDTFSVISVCLFAFSIPVFIAGTAILLQALGKNSLRNRVLSIWVPLFLLCFAFVMLSWLGLPNSGFGAVFLRVRGAIGYAVLAGMVALAAAIDAIARRTKKKNE